MSLVSSFLQVRVVELTVFTLHISVTVLPSSSTTTSGDDIEIAVEGNLQLGFISILFFCDGKNRLHFESINILLSKS